MGELKAHTIGFGFLIMVGWEGYAGQVAGTQAGTPPGVLWGTAHHHTQGTAPNLSHPPPKVPNCPPKQKASQPKRVQCVKCVCKSAKRLLQDIGMSLLTAEPAHTCVCGRGVLHLVPVCSSLKVKEKERHAHAGR